MGALEEEHPKEKKVKTKTSKKKASALKVASFEKVEEANDLPEEPVEVEQTLPIQSNELQESASISQEAHIESSKQIENKVVHEKIKPKQMDDSQKELQVSSL